MIKKGKTADEITVLQMSKNNFTNMAIMCGNWASEEVHPFG